MLVITQKDDKYSKWFLDPVAAIEAGTPSHLIAPGFPTSMGETVTEVLADGEELEYISKVFTGIPFSNIGECQTWRGDIARFIVENLETSEAQKRRLHRYYFEESRKGR